MKSNSIRNFTSKVLERDKVNNHFLVIEVLLEFVHGLALQNKEN